MSAAKLTSLATSTLSLLLERQRLQASHPTLHLQTISTNLHKIRDGVIALRTTSDDEAAESLRAHYERLRSMFGEEAAEKAGLHTIPPPMPPSPPPLAERVPSPETTYEPYTDDPSPDSDENGILMQQRQIMDAQDAHLDHLSSSIGRQHHISLQIGDELEDTELDGTGARMSNARRKLERVAQGAKRNGSTVTIALLILILLILIVVFKT
ncbi:uncharacterized protein F5891DRAFT_1028415 [Suillus fuscotomentosus]|uniref:t-SNARE coiled-coil homology domain-containing protein n=1 Tax=Suillus fuscotomentosus TaxID=1912939 RepID=A0AAD4HKZ9_9AGAM|nr:uncharacterized protein F5891DRAFT_1028415 [Suillus fuscotomentosus]KAG1901530.1 hypothetical protein F5891DRAFT_1028415 [Suillus fuscotomentosus]